MRDLSDDERAALACADRAWRHGDWPEIESERARGIARAEFMWRRAGRYYLERALTEMQDYAAQWPGSGRAEMMAVLMSHIEGAKD